MGSVALGSLVPVTLVLAVLLVGAVWMRRRLEQGSGDSVRLTGEHCVHVVTVEGRRWMIGTGPAGPPTLLAELPAKAPEAPVG